MLLVLDVSVILSLLLACNPNTTVEPLPTIVGPDGGQVVSGGVVLDIPEGALDAPVVIQLVDTGMAAPAPYDGLSTVWAIEPAGLVFSQPVQLQIPYDTRDSVPRFFWSDGAGGYASLEASFADGVATASIDRLSRGFVAARPVETIEFDTHIAPMDVLFVIDDSCSMAEEQARLAGGFASMLEALDAAQLDYHLGVVSTEMDDASQAGKLRQVSGERFITPTTDNALNTLSYMANLGTNGAEQEKGRAAAYTMLELASEVPRNIDFYRDEATLDVIFVTDADDHSNEFPIGAAEFQLWLELKKDVADTATAHGIVGTAAGSCDGVEALGVDYIDAVTASEGVLLDICEPDYAPLLLDVVEKRSSRQRVILPEVPSEVVEVAILAGQASRVLAPTEYSVDGATIRFDQGTRPAPGDAIQVRYR